MVYRFYAKLAELRQRIRANSMPTLNKDPDTLEDKDQRLGEPSPHQSSTLPKSFRKHQRYFMMVVIKVSTVLEVEKQNLL